MKPVVKLPEYTIEVERGGYNLIVHFDYSPGRPGVHTLPNGDPGYPDDPDELTIQAIEIEGDKTGIDLIGILEDCNALEGIEQACLDHLDHLASQSQDDPDEHDNDWDFEPDKGLYP